MASLSGREVSKTFKDLLHVYNGTENQGLETGAKRIFDGEGVGSPVWVSTNLLQVGTDSANSTLSVKGNLIVDDGADITGPLDLTGAMTVSSTIQVNSFVSAQAYSFKHASGTSAGFTYDHSTGRIRAEVDLETKGAMRFMGSGDDLIMDADNGAMKKGDGTKGKITLEDTSVKLQKGGTSLLEVKEDGTIIFQNLSSTPIGSPSVGTMIVKNGNLEIFQN